MAHENVLTLHSALSDRFKKNASHSCPLRYAYDAT